jgi:hypothetical protein
MDQSDLTGMMALMAFLPILFVIVLLPTIFFLYTLQKALARCEPGSRTMTPGQVWISLVPLVNLVWPFLVVNAVSESLHREFTRRGMAEDPEPGRKLGLAFATLALLSAVPLLNLLTGIPMIVCWILYWVKIAGYSAKLEVPAPAIPPVAPLTPQ